MLSTVKISLLIVACLSGLIVWTQGSVSYKMEDGLPSNHVYDINQDSEGYMWFATNRGVARFDGADFKVFTLKEGLPNNDVWRLDTDSLSRVWYFSNTSFQGYIKNDSVYNFPTQNKETVKPLFLFYTEEGPLLGCDQGFYGLDNDTFKLHYPQGETWERLKKIKKKYHKDVDFEYLPTKDEMLFIGKGDRSVFIINANLDTIFHESIQSESKLQWRKEHVTAGILKKQVFFRADNEGILFIDIKNKRIKYHFFNDFPVPSEMDFFFCTGTPSEIQFSTPGYFMTFNYDFELTDLIEIPANIPNIRSFRDKDGNLWMTGLRNGVTFIPRTHIISDVFFSQQKVEAIGIIKNRLFAGVYSKGFYEFNDDGQIGIELPFSNKVFRIYAVKNDPKNNTDYLISMYETIEVKNGFFSPVRVKIVDNGESENLLRFKGIAQLRNKKYVVDHSGILEYSCATNRSIRKYFKQGVIRLEEYDEKLFIGATDGLFYLNSDTIVPVLPDNSLLRTPINFMLVHDKFLIVGTNGRGAYIYKDKRVSHIKSTDGLMIQKCCLEKDRLWLATQTGIKMVALNKNSPENSVIKNAFYKSDGLIQDNINDLCIKNGILYAATDNGISRINPTDSIYLQKPDLRFDTPQDTLVVLPSENRFVSISFFVLDYVNQKHFNYWYRLGPNQSEWIRTTTKTLNFSSLTPNIYNLEVKVSDQHENTTIKVLYINVLPLWWETDISKICFLLLLLVILILAYKVVVVVVRKNEAKKSQLKKDMAALELQSLRSQMNPHFIHNSLNSIQYFIQKKDVKESENYLTKFSKLIRLFFDYSRTECITIQEEIDLIRNYLVIEHLRFENKLSYKINVDPKLDTEERIIPTMILQPIVENAVNHGIFHMGDNGMINVIFSFISISAFKVTVEDNGVGITIAKQKAINSKKNYLSRSSHILSERLKLLKESKEWEITHTTSNLRDDLELTGTKVELYFKRI